MSSMKMREKNLSSMRYTDNSFEKTEHSLEYIKE